MQLRGKYILFNLYFIENNIFIIIHTLKINLTYILTKRALFLFVGECIKTFSRAYLSICSIYAFKIKLNNEPTKI